nr:hypothetical protein BaRGS_000160 [Batillaria attramentaria]
MAAAINRCYGILVSWTLLAMLLGTATPRPTPASTPGASEEEKREPNPLGVSWHLVVAAVAVTLSMITCAVLCRFSPEEEAITGKLDESYIATAHDSSTSDAHFDVLADLYNANISNNHNNSSRNGNDTAEPSNNDKKAARKDRKAT